MRRIAGWILVLHAFAHSFAAMFSWSPVTRWSAAFVAVAAVAYLAAGLGLLGVPVLRAHWKATFLVATVASMHVLVWYRPPLTFPGLAIDLALFIVVLGVWQSRIDAALAVLDDVGPAAFRHPRWVAAAWTLGVVVLAYVAMVLALRPISLQWGSTPVERDASLPGDEVLTSSPSYWIDHAITIHAPARAVWPWLVQLGQDRGGFYSYSWLERAIGDHVRNADRIHPEWQQRAVDDTVLATQRSYLGGRLGTLGWRVSALEPERVIGLENWGTFVLRPVDSSTTRLIVRTRGDARSSATTFLLAPVNLFVFEPAHVIMERAMLRGIRDRAERGAL
ncbi:MAG: hypothetical protein ACREPM_04985 [Gemmatimonadaceae bacterium]